MYVINLMKHSPDKVATLFDSFARVSESGPEERGPLLKRLQEELGSTAEVEEDYYIDEFGRLRSL